MLKRLGSTDPHFASGMTSPEVRKLLNDPTSASTFDKLFQSDDRIHGLLKVAGSTKEVVDQHLRSIQDVLRHNRAIKDALITSSQDPMGPPLDGWTRPNDRGKEQ